MTLLTSFIVTKSTWSATMVLASTASNSTGFYALGTFGNLATTESDRTLPLPFEVEITSVQANVPTNNKDAATTISFRDDTADIGQLSFAAGETGKKTSGAISVIVASGSMVCFKVDTSLSTSGSIAVLPILVTGKIRTLTT